MISNIIGINKIKGCGQWIRNYCEHAQLKVQLYMHALQSHTCYMYSYITIMRTHNKLQSMIIPLPPLRRNTYTNTAKGNTADSNTLLIIYMKSFGLMEQLVMQLPSVQQSTVGINTSDRHLFCMPLMLSCMIANRYIT